MAKFNKLQLSDAWYQEMKKYPRGYTIIENLIDWLSQTNKLIDNVNDWNEYLDDFVENFDKRLEPHTIATLYQMAEDGTLDRIINENIFNELNTEIQGVKDDVDNIQNDVQEFKGEVNSTIDVFKDDVDGQIEEFKGDVNQELGNLSVDINGSYNSWGSVANKVPNPTVVIIDDDSRNELYEVLYPFLKARNIPFSVAVVTSRIGTRENTITYEQFTEMKNDPLVEFVNHTRDHVRLTELTDSEIHEQIRDAEMWLRREGIYTRHLVYPFGDFDNRVRRIASQYVDSASAVGSQVFRPDIHILDSMYINRTTIEQSIDIIKARIDLAAENRGLFVLNTHSQTVPTDKLQEVISYALNKGLQFKNFSDAYEDFSNIMELRRHGELIAGISATGFSQGFGTLKNYHPNEHFGQRIRSFDKDTPITSYPKDDLTAYNKGQTTITTLTNEIAENFGLPKGGTLETHTSYNDDYSYQIFHPVYEQHHYKRSWAGSQGWTDWEIVPSIKRFRTTHSARTIIGGGSQSFTLSNDEIKEGRTLIASPNFNIPNGVTYTVGVRGDGDGILRLYNLTNTDIELPYMVFEYVVI